MDINACLAVGSAVVVKTSYPLAMKKSRRKRVYVRAWSHCTIRGEKFSILSSSLFNFSRTRHTHTDRDMLKCDDVQRRDNGEGNLMIRVARLDLRDRISTGPLYYV